MSAIPKCIDCKHYKAPATLVFIIPVTVPARCLLTDFVGDGAAKPCDETRAVGGFCGNEGTRFEAKP